MKRSDDRTVKCPNCGMSQTVRFNQQHKRCWNCENIFWCGTLKGIDPLSPQGRDSFWSEYCREFSGHGADDGYERHEY